MKRDMDLVRVILLKLEAHSHGIGWVDIDVDGRSSEEVAYHVMILAEAGLVEAHDLTSSDGLNWKPSSLTWQGHEFLDAIKNETVWNKAKELIKEKGGSVPVEVIKALVIKISGSLLGL